MNRRMLVDTSMLFVFLLLLDYRYVHNFGHEMLALVFTALFLLHTIWNARWYPALFHGHWPKQRIVMSAKITKEDGTIAAESTSHMMLGMKE